MLGWVGLGQALAAAPVGKKNDNKQENMWFHFVCGNAIFNLSTAVLEESNSDSFQEKRFVNGTNSNNVRCLSPVLWL